MNFLNYLHICSRPDTWDFKFYYLGQRESDSISSDLIPSPRELWRTYAATAVNSYAISFSENNSDMGLLLPINYIGKERKKKTKKL